jgi:hypothetical protein
VAGGVDGFPRCAAGALTGGATLAAAGALVAAGALAAAGPSAGAGLAACTGGGAGSDLEQEANPTAIRMASAIRGLAYNVHGGIGSILTVQIPGQRFCWAVPQQSSRASANYATQ